MNELPQRPSVTVRDRDETVADRIPDERGLRRQTFVREDGSPIFESPRVRTDIRILRATSDDAIRTGVIR